MAKWYSNRTDEGTVLAYISDDGLGISCGEVAPAVTDDQILNWFLFNPQGANVGDLIFIDGRAHQVLGRRSE